MKTAARKYLRITDAKHVGRHRISLSFNDGTERVMDFGPFLKNSRNPHITAYRDLKKFKTFHIESGDLMWGDYEMIFPIEDLHRGEI